ncbi:unnamed protein product [Urochloa humidicola]
MGASEVGRRSNASSSQEFKFWPLHPDPAASPSYADELFTGGILLPLSILHPKSASAHPLGAMVLLPWSRSRSPSQGRPPFFSKKPSPAEDKDGDRALKSHPVRLGFDEATPMPI